MKKFWKALGIAALAAAVPVRIKKDEATGKKTFQSLLLSVDVGPDLEAGEGTAIGINIGEGILSGPLSKAVAAKREDGLFADDEPEAASGVIDFAQAAAEARAAAEEAQAFADEAQEAADEAQALADELEEAAEAMDGEEFDPEA